MKKQKKKSKATKVTVKIKGSVKGVRTALAKITTPIDSYGRDLS